MNKEVLSMISNSLTKYVFTHPKQSDMINILFGGTAHIDSLRKEVDAEPFSYLSLEWAMERDEDLAQFLFMMFYQKTSKGAKLPLDILWQQFENTPDYYSQIANYMLNSDDYVLGDRYVFENEQHHSNFRSSRTRENMYEEFMVRHQDSALKQKYYSLVLSIGESFYQLVNAKF